jgi:aconitate hydratase
MLPFTNPDENIQLEVGEYVYLPGIRKAVETGAEKIEAIVINKDGSKRVLPLELKDITEEEKNILLAGSLINSYKE